MTPSDPPAIRLTDFAWKYQGAREFALSGVDLTIRAGEFVGVVGPNEAGKTTLVQAIKGIIPSCHNGVLRGSVEVFGREAKDLSATEAAATVGMVFADPDAQFTSMSVEEEITFGLENLGVPVGEILTRLDEVAALTDLADLLEKSPHELSGGQKQRVAIAGVLAMQPRILILDEPTSMLDPRSKTSVYRLLTELKERLNLTVIVVEHSLERLVDVCDRLLLVSAGSIRVDAPTREFFGRLDAADRRSIRVPATIGFLERVRRAGALPAGGDTPVTLDDVSSAARSLASSGALA